MEPERRTLQSDSVAYTILNIDRCGTQVLQRVFFCVQCGAMKTDIHPEGYRLVIFKDVTSDKQFLISSTIRTEKTGKFEGKE